MIQDISDDQALDKELEAGKARKTQQLAAAEKEHESAVAEEDAAAAAKE